MSGTHRLGAPIGLLLLLGIAGCAPVAPWERGNLAKPNMALDTDALEAAFMRHAYSAKETASGGYGVGGGGCGCN
jgi:hypothetical protein